MRIPGRRYVGRLVRWARSRGPGNVLILGYHRVGNGDPDPFGLGVSARHFAEQMEVLGRSARCMALGDAVRGLAEGILPPRAVAVTFDDGYADTLHTALPVLERQGVPATVFVTTGFLGTEFWWDELARTVLAGWGPENRRDPGTVRLTTGGRTHEWRLEPGRDRRAAKNRRRVLEEMSGILLTAPPAARAAALRDVRRWAGLPAAGADDPRALTDEELKRLAASPLIEIGAHGDSHAMLGTLGLAEQRREVGKSRETLQALTGAVVTSFSYPHGSLSRETVEIVGDTGFTAACCSREDVAVTGKNPLTLPRFWVRDRGGGPFGCWLERWLHG